MGVACLGVKRRLEDLRVGETDLGDAAVDRGLSSDETFVGTVGMKELDDK